MDKFAVIERYRALLNELDEPASNVVLSAGSALVLLGIRMSTTDLDVDIPENIFRLYERSGKYPIQVADPGVNKVLEFDKDVDLHILDDDKGIICIGGVWAYSPSELLAQKRYLSTHESRSAGKRAADLVDIAALQTFIKEQTPSTRVMA